MTHPQALPHVEKAIVAVAKLRDYALNPHHDDGGSDKARVFSAMFGFTRDHADELARQILLALPWTPAIERPADRFGRRFQVDVSVTGPRGSGTVRTGWIIRTGTVIPSLTSAYAWASKGTT
jgi:filamentous hemagglutinin